MIPKPWQIDAEDYAEIPEYYPDYPFEHVVITYKNFYYNSYLVPCIAIFAIYGLLLLFIAGAGVKGCIRYFRPHCVWLGWWRMYFTDHPLVKRRHAELLQLPLLRFVTVQVPLRGDAMILIVILLANFLPLVAFYSWYIEDNVFWPGPTGKRDMLCRFLADRSALLGTACFPLLILFASKRTPIAILAHLEMSTLMLFHRWIARICWVHVLVHTTAFTVDYARFGYLTEAFSEPYFRWGCVGFGMMCGLVFLSLRAIRERWYELFVFLHIAMAVVAIVGVYLHVKLLAAPKLQMFVLMSELSAAFWAFDRVVRLATRAYFSLHCKRSRLPNCAVAHVREVGTRYISLRIELPLSRLRIQSDTAGSHIGLRVGPGDDIRLTVPRVQLFGEHPFTIMRTGTLSEDRGYLDLMIKKQGGLTRKIARRTDVLASSTGEAPRAGCDNLHVWVEGPFDTVPSLTNAKHAVLVAGGIAITYCWPMFTAAARNAYPALQTCKLIWVIRHPDTVDVIEEALDELVKEVTSRVERMHCRLLLDIHVTAAARATGDETVSSQEERKEDNTPAILQTLPTFTQTRAHSSSSSSSDIVLHSAKPELGLLHRIALDSSPIDVKVHRGRPDSMSNIHAHVPAVVPDTGKDGEERQDEKTMDEIHIAVCGPPTLCDDVRAEYLTLRHHGRRARISQGSFSY